MAPMVPPSAIPTSAPPDNLFELALGDEVAVLVGSIDEAEGAAVPVAVSRVEPRTVGIRTRLGSWSFTQHDCVEPQHHFVVEFQVEPHGVKRAGLPCDGVSR
jgi:hypothetical protein